MAPLRDALPALVLFLLAANGAAQSTTAAVPDERRVVHAVELNVTDILEDRFDDSLGFEVIAALQEFAVVAQTLELRVFASDEPAAVMFTDFGPREAHWLMTLMVQAGDLTDLRIGSGESASALSPLVGFHLSERVHYEALLDSIVRENPYLENWVESGKRQQAFTLYKPSVFAVLEDRKGGRMDHRDNLVVNSAAKLTLYDRYDVLPFWMREAVGLDAEVTLLDKVYGFSGSDEFVPTKQPGNWRRDIALAWRKAKAADLQQVLDIRFEDYGRTQGLQVLGLIRYLTRQHPAGLVELLESLKIDRRSSLSQDPYYVTSAADQWQMLNERLADAWIEDALDSLDSAESKSKSRSEGDLRKWLSKQKSEIRRRVAAR